MISELKIPQKQLIFLELLKANGSNKNLSFKIPQMKRQLVSSSILVVSVIQSQVVVVGASAGEAMTVDTDSYLEMNQQSVKVKQNLIYNTKKKVP